MEMVWEDCEDLKKSVWDHVARTCSIDGVKFVTQANFYVRFFPLQMTRLNEEKFAQNIDEDMNHFTREEIRRMITERPVDDLHTRNLFDKAREFAISCAGFQNLTDVPDEATETRLCELGNTVAVIAHAGMGKTALAKKLLQMVINKKKSSCNPDYVFYVKFQNIDYQRRTNLLTFLTGNSYYESYDEQRLQGVITALRENDKILIVMDGLDEAELSPADDITIPADYYSKELAESFILALLSGKFLCKAKKFVTSRPMHLLKLPAKYRPKFIIKILGITEDSKKRVCQDICGDDCDIIFNHIQGHVELSGFCIFPLICILVVYCIYLIWRDLKKRNLPTNITELYTILVCLYMSDKTHSRVELPLKEFCALAWHGILNKKIFFDENDLKEFGLHEKEKNDFTFTLESSKTNGSTTQYTHFSHLIIQEFFAAMHMMFFENVKEFKKVILSSDKFNLRAKRNDMVAFFLSGLCNESIVNQYIDHIDKSIDLKIYSKKIDIMKKFFSSLNAVKCHDNVIDWLFEMSDDQVARQVADKLQHGFFLHAHNLLPSKVLSLNYVLRLKKTEMNLEVISFSSFDTNFFQELGITLSQNSNIKLKLLGIHDKLSDDNISVITTCLTNVESLWICGFTSKKVIQELSYAINQRKTPVKELLVNEKLCKENITFFTNCMDKVHNLSIVGFSTKEVASILSTSIIKLKAPLKELLLHEKLNNENVSAIAKCLHNVEVLNIGGFSSNEVALKFSNELQRIKTKLKKLKCFISLRDHTIEDYVLRCQKNVGKIEIRRTNKVL